eukprot:jgi/Ulvmu1/7557/UM037_0101.1
MATTARICMRSECVNSCWRSKAQYSLNCRSHSRISENVKRLGRPRAISPALLPLSDPFGTWAGLGVAAAAGLWAEKTKIGKELSAALVATLLGLAFSNVGIMSCDAAQYGIVNSYLLPLAIPMLLLSANLREVLNDTGDLLPVFLVGSVATVLSTLVAIAIFPLAGLGENGWKIASALCARHIGGAINYVAVTTVTQADQAIVSAGLAADNLICALYFSSIYALARGLPPDALSSVDVSQQSSKESLLDDSKSQMTILGGMTVIALSAVICHIGRCAAAAIGQPGMLIPIITVITVALATVIPDALKALSESAEAIAAVLMQVFFAAVGANGSIIQVAQNAPALFLFAFLQVFMHLGLLLGMGKLTQWSMRSMLLASNANVGGPTTAAGMAAAKGWKSSIVPSLLIGTLGYTIATFIALALGPILRRISLGLVIV